MESSKELVLITGITGFLGSRVGLTLFERGHDKFKFRASVRNMNKTEILKKSYGEEIFN